MRRLIPPTLVGRLTVLTGTAVLVVVVLAVAAFNLAVAATMRHDADELAVERASRELAGLDLRVGTVGPPSSEGRVGLVWVFVRGQAVVEPAVDASVARGVAALEGGPGGFVTVDEPHTRLYALPVVDGPERLGTVISAVALRPYDETRRAALIGSALLGLAIFVAVTALTRWALVRALRPVTDMTRDASEWSDRNLDRRFSLGPPRDEVTRLAATLDGLLDRIAAGIRRERRLTAEISHELRTPLASISAEAELALRRDRESEDYREALRAIRAGTGRMSGTVDALLAAARQEAEGPRGTCDLGGAIHGAVEEAGAEGVEIALGEVPGVRLGVEAELLTRIVRPLIENARRHGAGPIVLEARREGEDVEVFVRDGGGGLIPAELESVFEPGRRGVAATVPGAGLGLSLARRLARSAGGDVTARAGPGGCFVVRLPAAPGSLAVSPRR